MHKHTYLGQTLKHEHPGGDLAHGYFGHPEDGAGRLADAGTYEYLGAVDPDVKSPLGDALALVDAEQGNDITSGERLARLELSDPAAARELFALRALAETVRQHVMAHPETGNGTSLADPAEVDKIEVTRVGARSERTRYFTLKLTGESRTVLVLQNNYTGHADSYALPEGEFLGAEVPGWSAADLDTLIVTAGELANAYGFGQLDRDDVLNTRQQQVLAKAARQYADDDTDGLGS